VSCAPRRASRLAAVVAGFIFALSFTAFPARAQLLIELPNPGDEEGLSASIGTWDDGLEILGLGTAILDDYAPDFFGDVIIRGAQLILEANGRLGDASYVEITNGGRLFLDNSDAAHSDRLGDTAEIYLYAGTLAFDPGDFGTLTQEVGEVILTGGANQFDLHLGSAAGGQLLAEALWQWDTSATLNIRYIDPTGGTAPTNVHFALRDEWGTDIPETLSTVPTSMIPWATITRGSQVDWVEWEVGVSTDFNPLTNYHTGGNSADWLSKHNVLIDGTTTPFADNGWAPTSIMSLKLANGGALFLDGVDEWNTLQILSGGLLSTGGNNRIYGLGTVQSNRPFTDANEPLYIHVHGGSLTVNGSITVTSGFRPTVKTGEGTLWLNGDEVYMAGGELVINQGTIAFEKGDRMSFWTVSIGDGHGTDVLELPANHTDPLEGNPRIFLHGTPYSTNPDSGEFDAAILRFGGGTIQNAALLHVEGRGTLDFVGGTESAPNMLWLEEFTLEDFETTMLFIRHWEDKHDVLLVRHDAWNISIIDADFLARIYFEGYGGPGAEWVYWNDDYWEIRPFPEPTFYGVLFGVVGLGLVTYRHRKRKGVAPNNSDAAATRAAPEKQPAAAPLVGRSALRAA